MAKNKKESASANVISYKDYVGRYGSPSSQKTVSYDEYRRLQQANTARTIRMAAERQRQQRVLSQYQMNRMQPAGWMNGGPAAQLQAGLDRMRRPEEEQEKRTPGFQDWSAASNLLDPNSRVNQLIGKRPQKEQDYWQGVREQLTAPAQPETKADKLIRPSKVNPRITALGQNRTMQNPSAYQAAETGQLTKPTDDYQRFVEEMNTIRKYGMYKGQDVRMMSDRQLAQFIAESEAGYNQALAKAENKEQERQDLLNAEEEKNKYRILAEKGLPIGRNREGGKAGVAFDSYNDNENQYEYIHGRPDDYNQEASRYDAILYDWFHGNGAYEQILEEYGWDSEEMDRADEEIERLWDAMESGEIEQTAGALAEEYDALRQDEAGDYSRFTRNIKLGQKEQENRARIAELEAGVPEAPEGGWKYDPSLVQTQKWGGNRSKTFDVLGGGAMLLTGETQIGDEIDRIYQAVGDPFNEIGADYFYGKNEDLKTLGTIQPAYYMTDEQRQVFMGYYESGDKASAKAYYDALQPYLSMLANEHFLLQTDKMSRNENAPLMIGARVLLPEVAGAMSTVGAIKALFGDEEAQRADSDYYKMSNALDTIQAARGDVWGNWFAEHLGEEWREIGQKANGLGYSIIDNARRQLITKGVSGSLGAEMASKTAKTIDFMLLGSDVMGNTMAQEIANGTSPDEAFVRACGSAAIEVITENMWWDNLFGADVKDMLGTKGAFAKYMFNIFQSEGFEEVSGQVMDTIFDECISALYGHRSELAEKYQQLIDEGMDPTEAGWKVGTDWMKETGWAYLSGGLSALISGGARGVGARFQNNSENVQIGKKALSSGVDTETDVPKIRDAKEVKNLFTIIETGEGFRAGTETKKIADEIRADIRKGKAPDKGRVGALVRSIVNESSETVSSTMKNVLQDAFVQELQTGGMNVDEAQAQAAALADMVTKGEYTKETMKMLAGSEGAQKILSEYRMGGFAEETQKAAELTQQEREAQKSVMDLITTPGERAAENIRDSVASKMATARYITEKDAEMQEALAAGEQRTGSPLEVVADGKIGNVTGFGLKEIKGENGTTWAVTAKVETADGTIEVDLNDVLSTNAKTAQVLQMVQAENGQSIGEHMTMQLLKIAQKTKDIAGAATDAISIAMDDLLGEKTKVTTLNKTEEQAMRAALEEDKKAADAEAAMNQKQLNPGKAKIVLNGVEYGSQKFAQELGKYGAQIRDEANYVARLMKSIGMDVEFYYDNSEEGSARQGAFVGKQGIRLNLAGTFTSDGVHRSVVATAAHEATHWMRANAQEAYRQLQTYALKGLQNANVNVRNELRRIMDNYALYGEHLTMDKAAEEMTAMGCEEIFTNEQLVSDLQAEDPTLYGKVKQAVQHVMNLLRKVAGQNMATSSRRYAQKLRGTLDQLAKVWKITYEAAKGATETGTGTGSKASVMMENDYAEDQNKYKEKVPYIDADIFDHEFLVSLHPILEIQEGRIEDVVGEDGNIDENRLANIGMDNAITEAGGVKQGDAVVLNNEYTGRTVIVTKKGIIHSVHTDNNSTNRANARVAQKAGMLIKHAVPINGLKNESDAKGTYAMAAPVLGEDGKLEKVAILTIEVRSGNLLDMEVYDQLHAASARKKNEARKTRGAQPQGPTANTRSSRISIAEFLDEINSTHRGILSQDVLNYYNEKRPMNGYWGQRALFSFRDEDYADAVARGDWTAAENMLIEKMQQTEGITGYRAPYFYAGEHKDIARLIKSGDPEVINSIVDDMAQHVPENAVLVPMPPHEGKVTDSTDTKILAEALSKKTGAPVIVALESDYHPSRYQAKASGDRSVNAQTMGFRQVEEIPEGKMPVFIDNMVGGGQTAIAAKNAIGRGITLAYAQSSRSKTKGVKIASVTYDSDGNLIPLSQRMDPENPSWKYSVRDEDYMAAVEHGDMETAQRMVDEAAKEAGYTMKVYHGTPTGGFTVFRGWSYFTENKAYADRYNHASASSIRGSYETTTPQTYELYMNPGNVFDTRKARAKKLYNEARMEYGMGELTETDSGLPDWTNGGDLVDFIEERELDYDTIMLDEGADGGYGEEVVKRGISYLTRSNNVKSADPVVYDDNGNVIPLSERFNSEKSDIRWSMREDEGTRIEDEYRAAYDRYTDLRLEVSKMKGDVDDFNERIMSANEQERDNIANEILEWQERTGYAKLQEELKEAEKEWKDAQKALDEYTEQRDVAEEQEKIRESGMTEAEWRRKQAVNLYGYTGDFREAGYLLPNGRMLNFCGDKGQHYGMRGNDHRDIGQLYASGEMQGSAAMIAFMKDGNIRVMAETPGVDISTAAEPTAAQYTAIRNMAYKFAGDEYFSVDLTDERGNTVGNYEYEGDINPSRIVNDIRYYFQNGKVREQSTVSMFHNAMFSIRDDTDYDVRQWMETVPEWSLQTEAEKQLLSKYKSMQMKQRLDRERMRKIDSDLLKLEAQLTEERTGRIEAEETMENALESAGVSVRDGHWLQKDGKIIGKINADGTIGLNKGVEENVYQTLRAAGFGFTNKKGIFRPVKSAPQNADGKPTIQALLGKSEAQRQRDALQKRKQDLQKTMDEQEEKLAEITKDEGFGRMMFQQQKVLDDLQSFGTQRELMDYVARMEKKAREVAARIEENRKATEALEKGDVVKRFRELLGTTTAEKTAAELKKEFSSSWTAKQIQAYLNPIILKMKSGQDFRQDVETLAGILVSSDSRNRYDALEDLRGLVITIGKGAQRELKAQNSSLKEVRARLAGTGIQVKYGDRSTLEADIEDLRAEYPMIPELGDEKDALGNFLNWVDSMKSASAGMEFYDQRIAEAMAVITGKAAGAAKGIYMPNDPKAQQQVLAMMDFVKGMNAETAEAQKALRDIAAQMGEMQKAGMAATNRATTLMRDVNVAIDYYQKIGKIAADEAKQKKQSAVIEQLKSKHAQEIVKNNEEWRALIQRDKDARAQLDENRKMTRQINTNLKRTFNLLKNPKGLQNIPEYMQGLAREVIGKFVDNDMGRGARLLQATQKELTEWRRILDAWEAQNGKFDRNQLNAMDAENVKADVVLDDLDKITDGMKQLNAWKIYGKNKLDALQQRGAIIEQIRDAVSEIYTAIRAEGEVQAGDRRVAVEDAAYAVAQGTGGKRFREWTGSMGQKLGWLHKAIVSGNMTPEYFFRTLGNQGLTDLWENYHWAENKNGLELKKAKDRLAQIAEEYGYKNWDMKQKIKLNLQSGEVEITLGQMMSLWATWQREKTLGPEMSSHLTHGGFYADVDLRDGLLGRKEIEKRAHRVTEEDMDYVLTQLTVDQMNFIDAVVKFMSNDMSELGNAASMQAYGIKLYKESYYFPFQMWDGVKSRKSNDAGGAAAANDRAFHPSFSKSRQHGANNAVMIGDFMQVATDHIAGMINYATMGLANENLQKVLNAQTADEYDTKRNTWALIEEAYGREAAQYLRKLQDQLNGGAVKTERSIGDKAISLFRKNAVAGSLSVALQQPLSYIRAALMINPKYLTQAVMKEYWKGSYKELLEHSGVAVIKNMGRFDMNAGQSAREYLTPDGFESKWRKAWNAAGKYSTILPEKMDTWTWTRMWVAVKAEQHAENPDMDMKSDEFLDMCGKRFNDIMRRTQVYDSTLVKSANMRSTNYFTKSLTSFMAEPTLTINCLADAVRMAKNHEKGGIRMTRKAVTMFMMTAVLSAAVKGLMGAGRNPDEKKTFLENFLYRFWMNLLGEINPFGLIPGYSDVVTLLKDGELSDDAMGAIGKIATATKGTVNLVLNGASDKGLERDLEDTVGQLAQIFTNIPAKNLMRDARAMVNFITQPYAKRENNWNVIKYQTEQAMMNTDTMISVLLKDAGFKTTNAGYYVRIYEAKKNGDENAANSMIDYLLTGKGVKMDSINSGVKGVALDQYEKGKATREETEKIYRLLNPNAKDKDVLEALDKADYKKEGGTAENYSNYTPLKEAIDAGDDAAAKGAKEYLLMNGYTEKEIGTAIRNHITDQYKDGNLNRKDAERMLKKYHPEMDADDIFWTLDLIDYKKETGNTDASGTYYRLKDAINANKSTEIRDAVKMLLDHGYDKKKIKDWIGNKSTGFKTAYLEARGNEKVRIKNALIMAYKAIGINETEANKIINKWK